MFRLLVVGLAVIGLVSLLNGALGTAAAGVGLLVVLPILLLKLFVIFMILGFVGRRIGHRDGGSHPRRSHRRSRWDEPAPTREDRFEEWHRMAHAKEEVDSWVEGMPDAGQQ